MKSKAIYLFCAILALGSAARAEETPEMTTQIKAYRILTNIAGSSSRTRNGVPGSFHLGNQEFDDVVLHMEGKTLTWNGEPEPDPKNLYIRKLFESEVQSGIDQPTEVRILDGEAVQYFAPAGDGLYELKTLEERTGIRLKYRIELEDKGKAVIFRDFSYRSVAVPGRKRLDGVRLDVGEPRMDRQTIEGKVSAAMGEWVGLTYRIPSQGAIYIFMRPSRTLSATES